MSENPILWTPSLQSIQNSQLFAFQKSVEQKVLREFSDYNDFHVWSVTEREKFWSFWLESSKLTFKGDSSKIYVAPKSGKFIGGSWFPNLKINFAENLIENFRSDAPMLIGFIEGGRRKEFTKVEVKRRVSLLARHLSEKCGIKKGSVVGAVAPNCPESVLCMLAATSLGAIWSSCSTDFGDEGILDRFEQIRPEVLFVADAVQYGGKVFELGEKNARIVERLKKSNAPLKEILVIPHWREDTNLAEIWTSQEAAEISYTPCDFQDPLFIMFSSGTTGKPKCIVHGIGGTLLQHTKEHQLHCDLFPGEKLLYYSTCGWMMWNWSVSAMASSVTVCCFDGSPAYPKADAIWKLIDREGIEVFGTSAKFISACRMLKLPLSQQLEFRKLRMVCSTGSPLLPEDFDYFYDQISHRERPVPVASISGGTDIISCFMLGVPVKPLRRGEIQGFGLGMDIHAFSSDQKSLIAQEGELVCASPFPSMPIYFFNDSDNARYRASYFENFPDVWHHGDYVTITEERGVVVHGRSDATLNPGGVRIGTAEIYSHVETHPAVSDSLVVGRPNRRGDDEEILLFVKLNEGILFNRELVNEIKLRIREGASPRHVPAQIFEVQEIPYTVSGKKVEIAIKRILQGRDPGNREALSNPQSLDEYIRFRT